MSSRSLGGGRILGSGKGLSPAAAAYPPRRSTTLLSPSASSVSVSSSVSTSQPSTDAQDLSSRVSLDHGGDDNGAAVVPIVEPRLVCPICNEEMVTLLQLNRHLDDNHQNLEEVRQDEVKDWFKSQMVKAKRFQPLAVLNQKFKGLDIFESNNISPRPLTPTIIETSPSSTPSPAPDPDDVISKGHWQRKSANDFCSDPGCGRRLNATNGHVNCRKCGKLFCDEHTMYQIKLSRSAQHEPIRGMWCRVCETCYKSRVGYNERHGAERNHTTDFELFRKTRLDKILLDVSRLEQRLSKLTQLLADPPPEASASALWGLSPVRNQRKQLEQSIVAWEDDASISRCPFCQQEFTTYTFRRHHCRLCGRVVCSDPLTECSKDVPLTVSRTQEMPSPHGMTSDAVAVDVRMCKDCRSTIFGRRDFIESQTHQPADLRAYENLMQFERGIRLLEPKFHKLLQDLQDPEKAPSSIQLSDASKIRKRMMDSFTQYHVAARRLRDLPTTSPTQKRLQQAIYQQASNFQYVHMLAIRSLPKTLRHAARRAPTGAGRPSNGALASVTLRDPDNSSLASSSSAISAVESEEKTLRERLIVLEEQSFLITEQLADAKKGRRFDEAAALKRAVDDLGSAIDHVHGQIGQLDFAGAYHGG